MRAAAVAVAFAFSAAAAAAPVDFRTQVYPLLHDRCFKCHQGDDASSGVRLDSRTEVLKRANPKAPADSHLLRLVTSADAGERMPPKGDRLTPAQVQTLRDWVAQGVAWDDDLLPSDDAKRRHWAFQPVKRPPVPEARDPRSASRNPVDAFILAKLREHGLSPAEPADRRVLLRRVSLDLTGLPPTPEEIDAFEKDAAADAYEKVVERLLASPAYGARWGRHWLDLVRYADSEGYESDHTRPHAWRYRDWVVKAFNDDKPYDRFLAEQLAGDELTPYQDENLVATGFLAAARLSSNEEDRGRQFNDVYTDIANATAAAVLGLTLHCAQCHSHKFDPITHRDYYAFQGFFLKGMPNNLALRDPGGRAAYEAAKPAGYDDAKRKVTATFEAARLRLLAARRLTLTAEQAEAHETPDALRTPEQHKLARVADLRFQFTMAQVENAIPAAERAAYNDLKKRVAEIEAKLPDPPQTWGFYSPATSPHAVPVLPMRGFYPPPYRPELLANARPFVLLAGDVGRRGPVVEVGWPAVFGPTPPAAVATRPRTALAAWLARPDHPLTARVWANRVWQWHFGRGIVDTPSDFGVRGAKPTHPELLDWLAAELMRPASRPGHGAGGSNNPTGDTVGSPAPWSTKHLHRLIVTSATYRQTARPGADAVAADPDNALYSRRTPQRLSSEALRDSLLAVSGELDRAVGGKPVADGAKSLRRGVYLAQQRQKPDDFQRLFDAPVAAAESCPARPATTTPLHALFLLNNPFAEARAKALAGRVRKLAGPDPAAQVEAAFRLALGRRPSPAESRQAAGFAAAVTDGVDALPLVCWALLNTNEFAYAE